MPAYLVADIDVLDPVAYATYRDLSTASLAKHGGRFLVRGGGVEPREGGWEPNRLVVIEFPSMEAARTWWDSPEYREARRVREKAARFRSVLVEGVP